MDDIDITDSTISYSTVCNIYNCWLQTLKLILGN